MRTGVENPGVPWMFPRPVSELPTRRVNGRVAEKLPGETLRLDQQIHQPLWGTVARGIGGGTVIASPSAHYPVVLPFGGCCGLGTNGAEQQGSVWSWLPWVLLIGAGVGGYLYFRQSSYWLEFDGYNQNYGVFAGHGRMRDRMFAWVFEGDDGQWHVGALRPELRSGSEDFPSKEEAAKWVYGQYRFQEGLI